MYARPAKWGRSGQIAQEDHGGPDTEGIQYGQGGALKKANPPREPRIMRGIMRRQREKRAIYHISNKGGGIARIPKTIMEAVRSRSLHLCHQLTGPFRSQKGPAALIKGGMGDSDRLTCAPN